MNDTDPNPNHGPSPAPQPSIIAEIARLAAAAYAAGHTVEEVQAALGKPADISASIIFDSFALNLAIARAVDAAEKMREVLAAGDATLSPAESKIEVES